MRIYVSGPMSGLPDHGFGAMAEAAARLRAEGHAVLSPAEETIAKYGSVEVAAAAPWEEHLRRDVALLMGCDAIYMLPGWTGSRGANLEFSVAMAVGIPQYHDGSEGEAVPELQAVGDRRADPSGAVKADAGKVRLELLPVRPLWGIAEVLTFGAVKYADHNWRRGFEWSRMYGAMQRHLTAWWDGEDLDAETGKSHLWHAGCDLLFLAEYEATGTGTDDRYKEDRG